MDWPATFVNLVVVYQSLTRTLTPVDPVSWDKAKDVLFEALERAAEEREAFVRERCSDPTTCDEILSLLSSARTRDDIIARAPMAAFAGIGPAIVDDSDALEPGSKVGPYLVFGGGIDPFWRGVVTPVSLVYSPPGARAMFFRVEQSYITNTITGASLGHPLSAFANNGEWNLSGTVGFDLRRIGSRRRPAP